MDNLKEIIPSLELSDDYKDHNDEDLLTAFDLIPRLQETLEKIYATVLEEIQERDLLVENQSLPLVDLGDDELADRRAEIRTELSEISKEEEALREERDDIDQEFIRRFSERGSTGARTAKYTISIREDDNYPEISDRTEFEDYLLKTGKLHLLQKRLSLSAIKEELAALEQEYHAHMEALKASNWANNVCKQVLESLHEEDLNLCQTKEEVEMSNIHFDTKLETLEKANMLADATLNAIKEHYSIPGISIATKLTINQVKRGSK